MPSWVVPLFAACANAVICFVVYRHDRKSELNQIYCLCTLTLVGWNLNIFSLYFFSNAASAHYWSTVFRTGTLLMPPTVVHTFVVAGNRRSAAMRAYLVSAYVLVSALVVANAFGYLAAGVQRYAWGYYPIPTRWYSLHLVSFTVNFTLAAILLVANVRSAPTPHQRVQTQFWLLGAGIAIAAGITNLLPMYHVQMFPIGNLGNVGYTGIVAYAIVRHRLMDIDVVLTKGMAYAVVILAVVLPAFWLALWLQRLSFGSVHAEFAVSLLILFLAVGAAFPRVRERAEARIERSFFPQKLEYRTSLMAFSKSIVRILDRSRLVSELASTLERMLDLDRVAIALCDPQTKRFVLAHTSGPPPTFDTLEMEHPFIRSLANMRGVFLRDELETAAGVEDRPAVDAFCRANKWEVCIPLSVGPNLIGFISLGRKRGMDVFSSGDLDLLETLAAEASIALENARLYDEVKRSQEIIRRADRLTALGTLAAGIAHEVRNPLVSIHTFFQLAPERLDDREFFTTFLKMTAAEVTRISNLITELLSFARTPKRVLGPVNLNDVVHRVVTLLEPEARKQKLTLQGAPAAVLPLIHADMDQICQMAVNIALNAIQATPPGGTVTVATRPVHRNGVTFSQIEVRDTGVGIPKDRVNEIFNPFYTTKEKGTGLGLSIAHQIVTDHGGFMNVESTEGVGTSFMMDLPISTTARVAAPQLEPAPKTPEDPRVRKLAV